MSSPVEDEIVSMKFDNTQFKSAATETLSVLDKLKAALHLPTSAVSGGLNDISKNVRGFNLNPLSEAAGEVGKAFSAMSVVAISAIATIASQATQAAIGITKSLTVEPIMDGYREYETKLVSIQTILANTANQGTTLDQVSTALDELNTYADKTIYNFGEMVSNVKTFTTAGVDLETSVASIKGLSNVTAVMGVSATDAARGMFQLSQALSSGNVRLVDWMSVEKAGFGGKLFQDAILETARVHGVAVDEMIKKDGSFRNTLQNGWLTSDILTETLSKFTGDLTDAQLKSMGYTNKQIVEIQKLAKTAVSASQDVKGITALFGTLKEGVGSGWASTFEVIFGNIEQSKITFTKLSNYFGGFISSSADARNQVLSDWKALGGRSAAIKAIQHAFEALMSVVKPFRDAFREIFPAKTGKQLFEITQGINHFFKALVLSENAQKNLKRTFAGFFAVLHIGFSIIKGVVHVLGSLIGVFLRGQGGTLALTGGLGDLLVALDKFLTGGGRMEKFFNGIATVLVAIIEPLLDLRTALIETFLGLVTGDPSRMFAGINDAISTTLGYVDMLSDKVASAINAISDAFGGLGHVQGFDLAGMFGGAGGSGAGASAAAAAGIDSMKNSMGGLSVIIEKIHSAWTAFVDGFKGFGGSALGAAGDEASSKWNGFLNVLHAIGNFLNPLYSQFQNVFGAIGDLVSSALSGQDLDFSAFLDAVNTGLFLAIFLTLRNFSTAISRVSKAASGVLNQVTSNLKTMQNQVRAQIVMQIALSLLVLAGAVFLLSKADPKRLGLALGAVTVMLAEMLIVMKLLQNSIKDAEGNVTKGFAGRLTLMAAGMVLMSIAVAAMAGAVYLFSRMDMGEMQRGLLGVTEAMAVLTLAAVAMSKSGAGANMIGAATGLLIMSAALVALSGAVLLYSRIDPDTLTNGLVKIAASIAVLALAMNLMKTGVGGAVAMVIVSAGLLVLSQALQEFAEMDGHAIARSMITLALSLAIIGAAMEAMTGTLIGAAALVIVAYALGKLATVLQTFGDMDTSTIIKGLIAMIGAVIALAITAAVIAPVVAILLALGAALFLIGSSVFLVGAGIALFAGGLALLAHSGTKGMQSLINTINMFLDALPEMIDKFGEVMSAIARLIGEHAPELNAAFAELMLQLIESAIKLIPRFGVLISKLIETGLKIIVSYYSDLAQAGLQLILNLLTAMGNAIPRIVTVATNLAIAFVVAMQENANRFAEAAFTALIDFMNGLADTIRTHRGELAAAGGNIADAIVGGITDWIRNAWDNVRGAIVSMVKSAASAAKDAVTGTIDGIIPGPDFLSRRSGPVPLVGPFADLIGGTEQVSDALDTIAGKIKNSLEKSKKEITKWQKKLAELRRSGGSPKEIEDAQKMLKAAQKMQKDAQDADKSFKKIMKSRADDLRNWAKEYDKIKKRMDDAQLVIDAAEEKVATFKEGVLNTFSDIPAPEAGQSLRSYMRELEKQTQKVIKFKQMLAAAQGLGLDPEQVKWFLDQGLDASKMLEQLLAGGPEAISQFEDAQANLTTAGQDLADFFASTLPGYDDAVMAAHDVLQGIINGLGEPKSLAEIEKAMSRIAHIMMKAIKKALDQKSPSRKMMEIGVYAVLGLTKGLDSMHRSVETSSAALGQTALDTLQATLAKAKNLETDLSISPVITPVLDLTQLTRDANSISSLMNVAPLNAAVSFARASDISAGRATASEDTTVSDTDRVVEIKLEQNNYSPKALNHGEIYRSSKSLIALALEAADN